MTRDEKKSQKLPNTSMILVHSVKPCALAMCKAADICWDVSGVWWERAVRRGHENPVGTQRV